MSGSVSYAQTVITERYEVAANQTIHFEFDDATIIDIQGWQENFVSVEASIAINGNTQNDKYIINESLKDGSKVITGLLKDKDQIPRIISIKKGDELFTFHTDNWNDPEIQKFYDEHGEEGISWKSQGISWEIILSIKVPKINNITIYSKHGMIELANVSGDIVANSTYGGIDLSVRSGMKSMLEAKTKWGDIYSNLDMNIDLESSSNKNWNHMIAKINGGNNQSIKLESKHANIYLRKK